VARIRFAAWSAALVLLATLASPGMAQPSPWPSPDRPVPDFSQVPQIVHDGNPNGQQLPPAGIPAAVPAVLSAGATGAQPPQPEVVHPEAFPAPPAPRTHLTSESLTAQVTDVSGLTVQVTDESGVADDRVVAADGLTHHIQVTVTDGSGSVKGAEISWGGQVIGITDVDGKTAVDVASAVNHVDWFYLWAPGGRTAQFDVAEAQPGYGAVASSGLDVNGAPFTKYSIYGRNNGYGWSTLTSGTSTLLVWTGIYAGLVVAADRAGDGYYLPLGTLTVGNQTRATVTVDVRTLTVQSLTVSVKNGDVPVTGASVALNDTDRNPSPGLHLDGAGTRRFYVVAASGETYSVSLAGGSPAVLGIVQGVGLGPQTLDFAGAPVLNVSAGDGFGTPTFRAYVSLRTWNQIYGSSSATAQATGSLLVWPGQYTLEGQLHLYQDSATWNYYFDPLGLGATPYISFARGDLARTWAIGGPVSTVIDGPSITPPGEPVSYSTHLDSAASRLY
jgi:hypothetical protein